MVKSFPITEAVVSCLQSLLIFHYKEAVYFEKRKRKTLEFQRICLLARNLRLLEVRKHLSNTSNSFTEWPDPYDDGIPAAP